MKRLLSPALLLLASMLWGFAFVAQSGASAVPPFTLGAARSILAGIFLILLIPVLDVSMKTGRRLVSRKGIDVNRHELIGGAICGVVLAVASFFQQLGINSGTDGGKAAFITALYVVLVPIYALALKRRAPLNVWLAVAISVLGFYLLCIKSDLSIAPSDAICLICSLIFPIHILAIDYFSPRCDGVRMSAVQFITAALFNSIMALIFEQPISVGIESITEAILPVLYLGIISSGAAYTLQIIGQRGVDPAAASIILSLESVFGVIGTAVVFGTVMTPREYAGSAIVLLAVILSQLDLKGLWKKTKLKKTE
ncbi:MAG: DMT family transporter [Clostridia bacterium]|nr:DMT family transporter [Clostridia bacterium]